MILHLSYHNHFIYLASLVMCRICDDDFEGVKILDCSDCPLLTSISNIEGLKILNCSYCPLLTFIPNIEGLKTLYCSDCPFLTSI